MYTAGHGGFEGRCHVGCKRQAICADHDSGGNAAVQLHDSWRFGERGSAGDRSGRRDGADFGVAGRHKLRPKAIVSTHAHIDHVGGLTKLRRFTGAPVMMHREDLALYQIMDEQAAFLGVERPETGEMDQLLKEGDVLRWGGMAANVMHTPGHTPGSISLYLPAEAGEIVASKADVRRARWEAFE